MKGSVGGVIDKLYEDTRIFRLYVVKMCRDVPNLIQLLNRENPGFYVTQKGSTVFQTLNLQNVRSEFVTEERYFELFYYGILKNSAIAFLATEIFPSEKNVRTQSPL